VVSRTASRTASRTVRGAVLSAKAAAVIHERGTLLPTLGGAGMAYAGSGI
jgi:hypothetical protein